MELVAIIKHFVHEVYRLLYSQNTPAIEMVSIPSTPHLTIQISDRSSSSRNPLMIYITNPSLVSLITSLAVRFSYIASNNAPSNIVMIKSQQHIIPFISNSDSLSAIIDHSSNDNSVSSTTSSDDPLIRSRSSSDIPIINTISSSSSSHNNAMIKSHSSNEIPVYSSTSTDNPIIVNRSNNGLHMFIDRYLSDDIFANIDNPVVSSSLSLSSSSSDINDNSVISSSSSSSDINDNLVISSSSSSSDINDNPVIFPIVDYVNNDDNIINYANIDDSSNIDKIKEVYKNVKYWSKPLSYMITFILFMCVFWSKIDVIINYILPIISVIGNILYYLGTTYFGKYLVLLPILYLTKIICSKNLWLNWLLSTTIFKPIVNVSKSIFTFILKFPFKYILKPIFVYSLKFIFSYIIKPTIKYLSKFTFIYMIKPLFIGLYSTICMIFRRTIFTIYNSISLVYRLISSIFVFIYRLTLFTIMCIYSLISFIFTCIYNIMKKIIIAFNRDKHIISKQPQDIILQSILARREYERRYSNSMY